MTPSTFRLLLVLEIILTVAAVVTDFTTDFMLPAPLKAWSDDAWNAEPTRKDLFLFLAAVPLLICVVFSYIGMFRLRPWGRTLFLICNIVGPLLVLFAGPTVHSPVSETLDAFSMTMAGVILALCYWTPVFKASHPPRSPAASS